MSEFPWTIVSNVITAILTFVGVIVGVFISELLESKKDKKRIAALKNALHSEVETIKKTLSSFEINRGIKSQEFPLIIKIYRSVYLELASVLTPDQLVALHRTYEEIKKLNETPRSVANSSILYFDKSRIDEVLNLIDNLEGIWKVAKDKRWQTTLGAIRFFMHLV